MQNEVQQHHDLSHVESLLAKMIRAYPTLRHTRFDAIMAVMNSPYNVWDSNGNIKLHSGEFADSIKEERMSLRGKADYIVEQYFSDNAEEIVKTKDFRDPFPDEWSDGFFFGTTLPTHCSFDMLKSIPDNANPVWIGLFKESLDAVRYFNFAPSYMSRNPTMRTEREEQLAATKTKAGDWKDRLDGENTTDIIKEKFQQIVKTHGFDQKMIQELANCFQDGNGLADVEKILNRML